MATKMTTKTVGISAEKIHTAVSSRSTVNFAVESSVTMQQFSGSIRNGNGGAVSGCRAGVGGGERKASNRAGSVS